MTNTLAYYDIKTNTSVKRFIISAESLVNGDFLIQCGIKIKVKVRSRANVIKTFTTVIYSSSKISFLSCPTGLILLQSLITRVKSLYH